MTQTQHRVGVCSWSLQCSTPAELARRIAEVGVSAVQLALDPLRTGAWSEGDTIAELAAAGITIRSGMMGMRGEDYSTLESIRRTGGVRLDEHWKENFAAANANAKIAERLALNLVSFHAGFLPHSREDPERARLLERLRKITDTFAERGVHVAFETGQETARTLAEALQDLARPYAGINFDPANMLLYDMGDPIAALTELAPDVRQIHIKDARRTRKPGEWGEEVVAGTGEVDWRALFATLRSQRIDCDLMIEREAGADRVGDIRRARELVERMQSEGAGSRA